MANRVGRKIYRAGASYRKKRAQKIVKFILAIILLAALVFVGYSVAKPIYNFINEKKDNSSAESPWTPPVMTDAAEQEDSTDSEAKTDETSQAETEQSKPKPSGSFSAYQLPAAALNSPQELADALQGVKESGYTAVSVTLKAEGGKIYYNTMSEMAVSDETAVVSNMYAAQISSLIKAEGFTPIAYLNILEDNNRYGEKRDGSYHFASDNSTWLDNSVANGGKPWLSPFETETQSYAAYLANEISGAGFEYVILDGLSFPDFRNSDIIHIGGSVGSADRYKALLNIADIAAKAVESNGSEAMIMLSAGDILNGKEEVFKPNELTVKNAAVVYAPSEIGGTVMIGGQETAVAELPAYDKAQLIFSEITAQAGEDMSIVPVLRKSDFLQADFEASISALVDAGYQSYVIIG